MINMKLVLLLSVAATAALAAVAPPPSEASLIAASSPSSEGLLAGREAQATCGSRSPCYNFMKHCTYIDCEHPFTTQCDTWCRDRLCHTGPETCRQGGECELQYNCNDNGVARNGLTGASGAGLLSRDLETLAARASKSNASPQYAEALACYRHSLLRYNEVMTRYEEVLSRSSEGVAPVSQRVGSPIHELEAAFEDACPSLKKGSSEASGEKGNAEWKVDVVEFQNEVKKRSERDLSPDQIEARSDQACPECTNWMKRCKRTQCARPWAPECQWDCSRKLCKGGPSNCRKGGRCVHCGAKPQSDIQPLDSHSADIDPLDSRSIVKPLPLPPMDDCEHCKYYLD